MHHLLLHAPAAGIVGSRPHREVVVTELTPDAEDLQPFAVVALDQEVVRHGSIVPLSDCNARCNLNGCRDTGAPVPGGFLMNTSIEFLIRAGQPATADALREYGQRRLS